MLAVQEPQTSKAKYIGIAEKRKEKFRKGNVTGNQ